MRVAFAIFVSLIGFGIFFGLQHYEQGPFSSDEPATHEVWAIGAKWTLTELQWLQLGQHWEIRVVASDPIWDGSSETFEPDDGRLVVHSICEALISHRFSAPSAEISRFDIFRVNVDLLSPVSGARQFDGLVATSVLDGACESPELIGRSEGLSYAGDLSGWSFTGFVTVDSVDWHGSTVNAAPAFNNVDESFFSQLPLPQLCEAAIFEAPTWRAEGALQDGDVIAVGVSLSGSQVQFFLMRLENGACFPLQEGHTL